MTDLATAPLSCPAAPARKAPPDRAAAAHPPTGPACAAPACGAAGPCGPAPAREGLPTATLPGHESSASPFPVPAQAAQAPCAQAPCAQASTAVTAGPAADPGRPAGSEAGPAPSLRDGPAAGAATVPAGDEAVSRQLLCERLALLLPEKLAAQPGRPVLWRLADSLADRLDRAAQAQWARLAQHAADCLPPGRAALWRAGTLVAPQARPELPTAFLGALILALRLRPEAALRAALLDHPDPDTREQAWSASLAPQATLLALDEALAAWAGAALLESMDRAADLSLEERARLRRALPDSGLYAPPSAGAGRQPGADLAALLRAGADAQAAVLLARRAGVALALVETALALRDRPMLLGLCRDAGYDAAETFGVLVQLAGLPPEETSPLAAGADPAWLRGALHELAGVRSNIRSEGII